VYVNTTMLLGCTQKLLADLLKDRNRASSRAAVPDLRPSAILARMSLQPRQGLCTIRGRSLAPRATGLSHLVVGSCQILISPSLKLPNTFCMHPCLLVIYKPVSAKP